MSFSAKCFTWGRDSPPRSAPGPFSGGEGLPGGKTARDLSSDSFLRLLPSGSALGMDSWPSISFFWCHNLCMGPQGGAGEPVPREEMVVSHVPVAAAWTRAGPWDAAVQGPGGREWWHQGQRGAASTLSCWPCSPACCCFPAPPQAGTASMWAPARTSPNSWMTGTALQSCSSATEYAHRT